MRILIDARFLGTGTGIARYTENLINNLIKIDKKNEYFIVLETKYFDKFNFNSDNFKKIKINVPYYSLSEQTRLLLLFKDINPDLVHFTNFNHPLRYKGICVFTIHDLILSLFPPKTNILKKIAYNRIISSVTRKAAKIIVPSKNTKNDLERLLKVDSKKIKTIYDGVNILPGKLSSKNIDNLKKKHKITENYLLYVGRFAPHKNVKSLIEAFNLLKKKYKIKQQLVLVGGKDKEYNFLREKVKTLGLNNEVIFTGLLPNIELSALYSNAFAFVLPSLYEGFGLPILEAMSYGIPVVCSNISSIPEIAGNAVHYFNPNDIINMADKIKDILFDSALKGDLIIKGKMRYKKFTWDKTARETLSLYESIIK